jgi:hypothetical protein
MKMIDSGSLRPATQMTEVRTLHRTPDGSILHQDGRVIYFSCERFVRDIGRGTCCFICGASPADAPFNDEHVIPDWVLRRFQLHDQSISLPNGRTFRYDRYKIPCCEACNSRMGELIERPVRELLSQDADGICDRIRSGGNTLLFVWMALIFLKTHLKDRSIRANPDFRAPPDSIADIYDWPSLHHLHCVVRSFYTGATMAPGVLGSFIVMPYKVCDSLGAFDYADLYPAQCAMIRLDAIILYAVFDDACGAFNGIRHDIERIDGPLNELQARELLADLGCANHHISERPMFWSSVLPTGDCMIVADHSPTLHFENREILVRGRYLVEAIGPALGPEFEIRGFKGDAALERLAKGDVTFTFDDDGVFIRDGRPSEQNTES